MPKHSPNKPTTKNTPAAPVGRISAAPSDIADTNHPQALTRRDFLQKYTTSVAFVLAFHLPPKSSLAQPETETSASTNPEVNAWIVIEEDDTVIIRIAQTELGQGVWTSNAMMVCEELQCDWSKVRPTYASVNRDGREMAPDWTLNVPGNGAQDPNGGGDPQYRDRQRLRGIPDSLYRRMRTNEAASVRDGRYYLQLACAEALERLVLAAAKTWSVHVSTCLITHTSFFKS